MMRIAMTSGLVLSLVLALLGPARAADPIANSDPGSQVRAPPPTLTRKQLEVAIAADRALGRDFRRAKAMRDAGFIWVMIGVTALFPAGILTLFALDPKDEPAPLLGPLIAAPIMVAVPFIVGGTLYGIGKKRTKRITAEYEARPNLEPIPMPMLLRDGGGVGFAGRF